MQRIDIPARAGRAVFVPADQRFRVVDVEGKQVGDLFAFNAQDVSEYASAAHTRAYLSRLFPRTGEPFVTNLRRPILSLERDDSPGLHDMLFAACDPPRYSMLGVEDWHPSCTENLRSAMSELGYPDVEIPQPINLFMNIPVTPEGELGWGTAMSVAGDSVTMRTELDCIVMLSACPQDIVPINDQDPTPMAMELLDQ